MDIYILNPDTATGPYRDWMLTNPQIAILNSRVLDKVSNAYAYQVITPHGPEIIGTDEMQVIQQFYTKQVRP